MVRLPLSEGQEGNVVAQKQRAKSRKGTAKTTFAQRLGRRLGRLFLSVMAILGGLITSLLLQAIFSGVVHATETPFFSYRLIEEDQAEIRAQLDACGSDVNCFMRIIGGVPAQRSGAAYRMRQAFELGLGEMHPIIRRVVTLQCQLQRQYGWILMTQCGRDKLFVMQEDVRQIQLARMGELDSRGRRRGSRSVPELFAELAERNHFSTAIVAAVCESEHPTAACFDGNLGVLRDQLLRAHDAMAAAFIEAVTVSSAVYFCSERVGFGRCSVGRDWNDTVRMGPATADSIAYLPARPLPGLEALSPNWTRAPRAEDEDARRRRHRRGHEEETGSGGRGSSGAGRGSRTGDGRGRRAPDAPRPVPAVPAPSIPTEGGTFISVPVPAVGGTGARPPETPPPTDLPEPRPPTPTPPDEIPPNVPAGTPPQDGITPPPGVIPEAVPVPEVPPPPVPPVPPPPIPARPPDPHSGARGVAAGILADLENELGGSDGCSPERMAQYEQIIQDASSGIRGLIRVEIDPLLDGAAVTAEVSRYACEVSAHHSTNPSARFLAQAAVRLAIIFTDPDQNLPEIFQWAEWMDTALSQLEANPGVSGAAELAAFHQFLREQRVVLTPADESAAELDRVTSAGLSLLGSRNNPRFGPLNLHFCPWRRAVEAADHGSANHFPRSLISCR